MISLEGMLAHAKDKNVYDALVKAELTEYLRTTERAFDLIVSADTLVYFGDLEGVLVAATEALRPTWLLGVYAGARGRRRSGC